ncbi:amidohydrolase family protein [Spirosoma agri]|uniref:Amidohydrolase family protein n=1 Tax=Spirosoma agri TaxID=1987381 RepID=A0A6M0IPZ7_9BACT|nr:membrane dipeptidase [Spirosoma agri]NEU70114.1 amidohydrolase family protein [Spirosoma agri]
MKHQRQWSRRNFLSSVAGASVVMRTNALASWATDRVRIDPRVAAIVAKTICIDTHNHVDVPFIAAEVPGPQLDLAGAMNRSGLSAICMTISVDRPALVNPGDAYERYKNALASMDSVLTQNGVKRALNLADLRTAHTAHQPTVIQSIEGGHFLEGHLDRLDEAYTRGLRHLGLLHDNDASVPLGDVYTSPPQWGGLTAFGADVIRACNRLGILVDLTHASNETVNAALKVATKPIVISHTGLNTQLGQNERMAAMMKPRLISKEQAQRIARAGGVIGVWTHLADTPLAYAQNIRALVDVVGIDHVCLGTDTKLTPSYRSPCAQKGPGGGQQGERIGERTNGAWADQTVGFYYAVVDALLTVGFSGDEIGRVGGGNFCRVFDAATAGHH